MTPGLPLVDFIDDFSLRQSGKAIYFNARIHFESEEKNITALAEVHIVGIKAKNINSIYIINPEINAHEIPDMLNDKSEIFEYRKKECFIIIGYSKKYKNFTLYIYPENNPL